MGFFSQPEMAGYFTGTGDLTLSAVPTSEDEDTCTILIKYQTIEDTDTSIRLTTSEFPFPDVVIYPGEYSYPLLNYISAPAP